jgi:hypothetical protein
MIVLIQKLPRHLEMDKHKEIVSVQLKNQQLSVPFNIVNLGTSEYFFYLFIFLIPQFAFENF